MVYIIEGIVGVVVGRKSHTKKLYTIYMILSSVAAIVGVFEAVLCIEQARYYCPALANDVPHPILNPDCTYKEEFVPYLKMLDLRQVDKALKAIPVIFNLAAFFHLCHLAVGMGSFRAFFDDHYDQFFKADKKTDDESQGDKVETIELEAAPDKKDSDENAEELTDMTK